ncbi:MAG: alpha/beta hydrolase [Gomphosphaeria aponina SAG 52.96 = DSM 107014]|uniref:Alpha/beta hydrolase n=1 Tax=Gomphosphaeria aponina SAG 52.96 = DSM 107014 TaxID=1521640 RepID=A0A941JS77_9CHRO|nr:alpha/beta hydrolase [Gomphosphaeria aponina SAG 52.96 = DSM 107014]
MTVLNLSSSLGSHTQIGGTVEHFSWNWQQQQELNLVYEKLGQGNPVLLLPAFSTVSSRTEMAGIARLLADNYEVFALDWLGFGGMKCAPLDYQPPLYHQLLTDFVVARFSEPITIVAAGHATGYAVKLAQTHPDVVSKLVLIAPTWCGPLRVMGVPTWMRQGVKNLVRSPIIGQFLYYLNTTPGFLRFMYSRHVYVDQSKLTKEFITEKRQITQHRGARYAPVAFVTGAIDPVTSRSEFLELIESVSLPILTIIAKQAPPYSLAEMEAMGQVAKVETVRLAGTLGIHEEEYEAVYQAIRSFI